MAQQLYSMRIDTNPQKIDEILSRGVEEVIGKDELRKELLSGKRLRIKFGVDPTSPNIHLGRMVPILKLLDFQKLGHTIVFIVGDFTGIIGDTSDKESERPMLSEKEVKRNLKTYFTQAGKLLNMRAVEKKYNSAWLKKLGYKEIGEQANIFSVADFIARDNIKKRLTEGKRVSLREVLYPLMQGYDSVKVCADVELGGTDQRFNILAGRKMQEHYGQKPQTIILTGLIAGLDGRKMSSSWGNTINITDTPVEMYGKVMSMQDDAIAQYIVSCTRVPMAEAEKIRATLEKRETNPRDIKMRLAREIVALVHSEKEAKVAEGEFVRTFQKKEIPDEILEIRVAENVFLSDVFAEANVVSSKNEFRRLVEDGAVKNAETGEKIEDVKAFAREGVWKVGKRRFVRIVKEK